MIKRLGGLFVALVFTASSAVAATGTLMPSPFLTVLDANGNPVANAKVCTYVAGTTTPATTYTDVALTTPQANPIRADSAGRFGPVYLTPGASYKIAYQDATGTAGTCDGASIKTVDNVSAVPASSVGVDVSGTAGEALTAGQAVYLSDGSGSKNAGQWYKADPANTYSSTLPQVGIVPASIGSGQTGSIRLVGVITGLSSLTIGSTYYVSTAGAITATAPANARKLGTADTVSSLVLVGNPAVNSCSPTYTAKTAIYTAVACDLVSVTSGTFTVTLPAASANGNKPIWVVNNGTGTVTIGRTGSDTIGLATSQTLNVATASAQGDSMTFISDGVSNWIIF